LPLHGIFEICGEAGSGKTQLCLQLALQAMLPPAMGGLGGQACYLSSGEGRFPLRRFQQLAALSASRGVDHGVTETELMQRLLLHRCDHVDSQFEAVEQQLPSLLAAHDVKVVIIDSIAGAFRGDDKFDRRPSSHDQSGEKPAKRHKPAAARTQDLFLLAAKMRRLSLEHHVPFVVVNQVTADFGNNPHVSADAFSALPNVRSRPALGLGWSCCVNQRLMLLLPDNGETMAVQVGSTLHRRKLRTAALLLSPVRPFGTIKFFVAHEGVIAPAQGDFQPPDPEEN